MGFLCLDLSNVSFFLNRWLERGASSQNWEQRQDTRRPFLKLSRFLVEVISRQNIVVAIYMQQMAFTLSVEY